MPLVEGKQWKRKEENHVTSFKKVIIPISVRSATVLKTHRDMSFTKQYNQAVKPGKAGNGSGRMETQVVEARVEGEVEREANV